VLCPIFFVQRNGALGIPYQNPAPFRSLLHNAKQTAPALLRRENQNVRMRIQVKHYPTSAPPPPPSSSAGGAFVC
jgi:hypothetical protein